MREPIDAEEGGHEPRMGPTRTAERLAALEDRVRKLETAVAERDGRPFTEESVADRVLTRLSAMAAEQRTLPESDRVLVLDSVPRPPAAATPSPPQGAVLRPPEPADPTRRSWLVVQLVAELRLALRMYFDPRYRISRTTQFVLPVIGLVLIFNYFFFAQWLAIPLLSPVTERLLAVILAVLGYKILTRELARYREVLEYLARYG